MTDPHVIHLRLILAKARPDPEQNLRGGAKFPGGAPFQHIK